MIACLVVHNLFGYRSTLLKELQNFAHLNLAVALFLALTVFAVGIETATKNKVSSYICDRA